MNSPPARRPGRIESVSDALQRHIESGDASGLVALVARGADTEVTVLGTQAVGGESMREDLAEWRVTETGWLQVFCDAERAGSSMVNFAIADLEQRRDLHARGIDAEEIVTVNKGVRLCSVKDPDNNTITFIGDFREHY